MSIVEFIRDRARHYNCPVCGRVLKGCDVKMLNQDEDRFTVQVTCASCDVTFIMILAIHGAGLEALAESQMEMDIEQDQSRPLVAEAAERALANDHGPIESDELLDLHLMLRDFGGSLTDLFRQRQRL